MDKRIAAMLMASVLNSSPALAGVELDASLRGRSRRADGAGQVAESLAGLSVNRSAGIDGRTVWSARRRHRTVGQLTINRNDRGVSYIRAGGLNPVDVQAAAALLAQTLIDCRDNGDLKVVLDSPMDPALAQRVAEAAGYRLSRRRDDGAACRLEFYANLYHRTPQASA